MKSIWALRSELKKSTPSTMTVLADLLRLSAKLLELMAKPAGEGEALVAEGEDHPKEPTRAEALEGLVKLATNRIDQKTQERQFLLHRATEDFEYEGAAGGNEYSTDQDTEWVVEFMTGEKEQEDFNPVVSVWVPESAIKEIPHALANTGTWGDLGKNPNATKYKIVVAPGTYELHTELKA